MLPAIPRGQGDFLDARSRTVRRAATSVFQAFRLSALPRRNSAPDTHRAGVRPL